MLAYRVDSYIEESRLRVLNFGDVRVSLSTEGTFAPSGLSLLVAFNLFPNPGDVVCDVGTGSGILALLAAKRGAREVWGIDIDPTAIAVARANAAANNLEQCRFVEGRFFDSLPGKRFDLIASNPPATPACPGTSNDDAINGGETGNEVLLELVRRARTCLAPHGRILVPICGWASPKATRARLEAEFQITSLGTMPAYLDYANWGICADLERLAHRDIVKYELHCGVPVVTHELVELRLR